MRHVIYVQELYPFRSNMGVYLFKQVQEMGRDQTPTPKAGGAVSRAPVASGMTPS